MKKLNRIISAILVLASLLSVFAVFTFASAGTPAAQDNENENEGGAADTPAFDPTSIDIIFNRTFDEGWDYTNGFSKMSNHTPYIDYEETVTRKYNYFWRIEASASQAAGTTQIEMIDALRESGTVISLKIKADDACDIGKIMGIKTALGSTINLLYISGKTLYAYQSGAALYKLGELSNDWLSVTMVFDWDAVKENKDGTVTSIFKSRVYYGDEGAYIDYETNYATAGDIGWRSLHFTIPSSSKDREGMSYCIDDLQVYNRSKVPLDLSGVEDYGSLVDFLADTVIDIQDGPGKKSREQIIAESLCMKVRVDNALVKNKKVKITDKYCAPEIIDGNVMVPLELLIDYMGYDKPYVHGPSYDITTGTSATYITIGRDTANVSGERINLTTAPAYLNGVTVIAAVDIPALFPGWCMNYDDMGFLIVYNGNDVDGDQPLFTREKDLNEMLEIMKSFVFDIVTKDENGNDFEQVEDSYRATGNAIVADLVQNAKNHPYIFTNQATFDKLSAAYASTAEADAKFKTYLSTIVGEADDIIEQYAAVDSYGTYSLDPEKKPINVYGDGKSPVATNPDDTTVADTVDGYTPRGTLESIKNYSELLVKLAFAYQITREAKYADLAYDISLALGEWTHWGPADMVNCATAVGNFAVAYDWLYNYYASKTNAQTRINKLTEILYEKGVKHGYNASFGIRCEFAKVGGGGDVYNTLDNYVNVISSANMIIGSLVLAQNDEYKTVCADLIGNNIQHLIANGLDKYAPDGSYAESAIMWAEATNGFLKLIMALESSVGTTYGFEDTWGIDKTFYYAYYIEDSDGFIWNYHEGGPDGVTGDAPLLSVDTQMFNFAGKFLKDSTLLAIRKNQLEKGKPVTMFDLLFYPEGDVAMDKELALDYHMEGIHAFVSRSDWNEGALYTGIMGGSNSIYGAQLDSGNFIYRNKGINWIIDLGSDNEEIYSYYGAYRFHHYRTNADGQNVIIINTAQDKIPYGQLETGNGVITRTYTNEYGSYATISNKSAYGSAVNLASRGMLVTNDRKTVVIQDEMSFTKFQEVYWIAHTASRISIDSTEKVAYLTDKDENGNEYTLRATIVSRADLKFKAEENTTNGKLSATYKDADYKSNGGIYPNSRTGIKRLVISAKNIITFNVAVVFEIVDGLDSSQPLGYTWSDMSAWMPSEKVETSNSTVVERGEAVKQDISNEVLNLDIYAETLGTAYSKDIENFYASLTKIEYTLKTYPEDTLDDMLKQSYAFYKVHRETYLRYVTKINTSVQANKNLTMNLSGMPR